MMATGCIISPSHHSARYEVNHGAAIPLFARAWIDYVLPKLLVINVRVSA